MVSCPKVCSHYSLQRTQGNNRPSSTYITNMKYLLAVFSIFALIFGVYCVEKSACTLPKVVGPCRKADFVFYYNSEAKECQEFIYGGCDGNDNRFESKEQCDKLCKE